MPPRPRPKAKSNAPTNTGRGGSPPTSPVKRSPKSPSPIRRSTPYGRIATPRKSITNWARRRKEKRSVVRPASRCPWWDYVWSVRTAIKVGSDGRGPIGTQRLHLDRPPGSKVVLCLHPTGHHSVLAAAPDPRQKPVLLFTNRPQ